MPKLLMYRKKLELSTPKYKQFSIIPNYNQYITVQYVNSISSLFKTELDKKVKAKKVAVLRLSHDFN